MFKIFGEHNQQSNRNFLLFRKIFEKKNSFKKMKWVNSCNMRLKPKIIKMQTDLKWLTQRQSLYLVYSVAVDVAVDFDLVVASRRHSKRFVLYPIRANKQ